MSEPHQTWIERASAAVNAKIESGCGWVARLVTKHPRKTIAAQYVLTVLCACGFANLKYDRLPERLYVPQGTQAFEDRKWVEKRYGFTPTSSFIYVDGKRNLLSRGPLRDLFDLHDKVMSLRHDDGEFAYDERYCHKKADVCQRNGILAFWNWNRTLFELDEDIVGSRRPRVPAWRARVSWVTPDCAVGRSTRWCRT